jgi:hypothetical protein
MAVTFNPFTGNFDFVGAGAAVPDPLTVNNLTVNTLLTAAHIHGNLAGSVYIHVKNLDTAPLEKGTPFYISGTVGSSDRVEIKRADADGSGTGPAIGLVESTLAVNGEGNGVIIGEITNYDTATPGWATNDALYVSTAGTLTNVRPTTGYRQIVGHVGRVHASTGTIVTSVGKKEPVAGSNTQIQFNDDGGFGASSDLTFNKTTKQLTNKGDINLDDGGTFTTTIQCVTPTANRTLSFPNATGTVGLVAGSSGQLIWNNAGAYAGVSTLTTDSSGNITLTGRLTNAYSSIADNPAKRWTGTWFTGGTATTTKPHVLIEPTGTTSTAWSTSGTGLGVNAASGFAGNLLDLQVNGASRFKFDVANKRFHLFTDGTRGDAYFDRGGGGGDCRLVGTSSSGEFIVTGFSAGIKAASYNCGDSGLTANLSNGTLILSGYPGGISEVGITGGDRGNDEPNPLDFVIRARARGAGNSTNTSGIHLRLLGGQASSAATNTANGGNINLDGGQGYGTGTNGNIIIGATRGNLQITDARDIILGSTTGTKIGTATTQKLGFFNKTPVVQPTAVADLTTTATTGTLPTANGTVTIADATTPTVTELLEYCVELEAKLEAALSRLRDLGLIAT